MFRLNGEWDIISMAKKRVRNFKLSRSLGLRIFMIICAVGIIPGVILRSILLNSYETRAISVKVSEIQNQCTILANHLVTYGYLNDQTSEVVNAELEQFSSLYDGRIMIIDSDLKIIKDTYSISQGKIMISEEILKCFDKTSISKHDKKNQYIEFTTPITNASSGDVIGVILTSVSTDNIAETIKIMGRRAYLFEIMVAVVTLCFSVFITVFLLKPFRAVNTAIIQVEEGFTEEKISVPVYNETLAISDSFNRLMEKMNTLEASRQEFVANVSHELKTPITSMKVLADSLLSKEDVPVELYREFMNDISVEIDREDKIINDLLSLVKLDRATSDLMNISVVDVNKMLEDILKRVRPIADKAKVDLILESIRPVSAEIDEIKLSLAIMNVIENAIKYNRENGWVKVTVDADHQFFTVVVADSGIGIPEESLAHIYERFYRVDKSHSREIGGTGLGLAITRNAILMHDGAIKVESTEGVGTSFTIKVPKTHKTSTAVKSAQKPVKARFKWRLPKMTVMLIMLMFVTGCSSKTKVLDGSFLAFYPGKEGDRVAAIGIELNADDTEGMIEEVFKVLRSQPADYDLRPALSEDVEVISTSLKDGVLLVDFGAGYYKTTGREEILRRAAIVRTLDQIEGVNEISFTVEGAAINDSKGVPIGVMTSDMFIDNAGDEINSYERTKLKLYFADAEGTGLVETSQTVAYNSNISMEKLVCEHIISGPLSEGAGPVTDPDVRIMAVTTKDGICYVNLSKEFLTKQGKLTDEVVLYSFVNSLTELPNVNKVQFMIDSETEISFGDHSYLNAPFERNLELVDSK